MQNKPNIPEKLYFKIGEVAELIGVEPHVLRFWESEFAQISPSKSKTQQRLYQRSDVELILQIRELLYDQKFTIEGAKNRLKELKAELKKNTRSHSQQIAFGFEAQNTQNTVESSVVSEIKKVIQDMDDFLSGTEFKTKK